MNDIRYTYKLIDNEIRIAVQSDTCLFLDDFYAKYNVNIEDNESINVIPFIGQILPIVWLNDLTLYIDVLDSVFASQLDSIKAAYQKLHPLNALKGNVVVYKLQDNRKLDCRGKLCLFSGGVDSTYTMHVNLDANQFIIGGSDIKSEKDLQHMANIANARYGNQTITCDSNFRTFFKTNKAKSKYTFCYWEQYQSGLGMLSLAAPVAYNLRYKYILISASLCSKDLFFDSIGTYPSTDNQFKVASSTVDHIGFELTRLQRTKYILDEKPDEQLRVCWRNNTLGNCSKCIKCLETILQIYVLGYNPLKNGFDCSDAKLKYMIKNVYKKLLPHNSSLNKYFYEAVQYAKENNIKLDNCLQEILDYKYKEAFTSLYRKL